MKDLATLKRWGTIWTQYGLVITMGVILMVYSLFPPVATILGLIGLVLLAVSVRARGWRSSR